MRWHGAIGLAALALLGFRPAAAHAQSLVVIGGGLEDPAIYDRIIELGGGPERARIGILTTGSATPEDGGRFYVDAFAARGGKAEWLPLTSAMGRKGAEDPALVARAAACNVFFLGGGNQRRYTRALLRRNGSDTALLRAIRRAYEAGGVVAGTSAGAAAMVSHPMVTGGESYDALARPRRITDRRRGGLRFFLHGLIDTHFGERGRQGRIARLAARRGVDLAFGIDEDTALVVTRALDPDPGMEVVGRHGVTVFDLTHARSTPGRRWRIENLRSHYLLAGDSYSVKQRRFRARADRPRDDDAAGRERPVDGEASDRRDIFSAVDPARGRRPRPRSFIRTAQSAMSRRSRSTTGHPVEDASWRVSMRRGRGAARYRGGSYRNLRVDIIQRAGRGR